MHWVHVTEIFQFWRLRDTPLKPKHHHVLYTHVQSGLKEQLACIQNRNAKVCSEICQGGAVRVPQTPRGRQPTVALPGSQVLCSQGRKTGLGLASPGRATGEAGRKGDREEGGHRTGKGRLRGTVPAAQTKGPECVLPGRAASIPLGRRPFVRSAQPP